MTVMGCSSRTSLSRSSLLLSQLTAGYAVHVLTTRPVASTSRHCCALAGPPPLKHQLPPSNTTASPNKHNWTHLTNTAAPPQRPLRQVKVLWCTAAIFTVVWAARQLQQQRTHDRHNRWPINSKPRGRLCHTIASSGRNSIILLK